jgi:predicted DNA binding CopG/RHH family protein
MRKKIRYTDEPLGRIRIIEDFLPPPEALVLRKDKVKVTLELNKGSIDFFKREARKQKTSYQKMIREVVDIYVSHFQEGR